MEIRSPNGGALQADGCSDPEDASGYSAHDIVSLGFRKSPSHAALLADTRSIADVNVADHDAIFVTGGQSPMTTFRGNVALQALVARLYEAGKITALVCHGTCLLLETRLSDGSLVVSGKSWTGFADSEEQFADSFVGRRIHPFWIEDEARRLDGTNFVAAAVLRRRRHHSRLRRESDRPAGTARAMTDDASASEESVTVVVTRRVKPGCETDYEDWLARLLRDAAALPGSLGTTVHRPPPNRAGGSMRASSAAVTAPAGAAPDHRDRGGAHDLGEHAATHTRARAVDLSQSARSGVTGPRYDATASAWNRSASG